METKQKNQDTARRSRPERGEKPEKRLENTKQRSEQPRRQRPPEEQPRRQRPAEEQPRRRVAAPPSAQQGNGAVRMAEAQRQAAAAPKRPAPQQEEREAAVQQEAERPAPQRRPREPRREVETPQRETRHKGEPPRGKPRPDGKKAAPAKPGKKPVRPRKEPDDTLGSTRRAYGKTKPKKKSTLSSMSDVFMQTAHRTAERVKAKRAAAPKKKRSEHAGIPTPAVIYTQPQAFNRSRFAVQLVTVAAVVAALVLGMSVFFKVKTITVSGAEVYSAWAVREASGIKEGDNLMSFGNARAGAQIHANLPYVKKVRLGIKLPDTVNIMIEEEDVVYAIKDSNGIWWMMTSDGRVVEQSTGGKSANYTQILGVTLDNPVPGQKAVAMESAPTETDEAGEPIPVAVTGAHRLMVVLQILKALEDNDIVGEAASVEVTRIEDIILWYGTRYQVNLGDANRLEYKIACMNDVILQMSDYQSGILDISFNIWPDKVGYTPFA